MAASAARLPPMTLTATRINPPGGYENLSRLCRAAGDPLLSLIHI